MAVVLSGPPNHVELPAVPLEPIPQETKDALEREVFRVNDRYLVDFIEAFSYCPFAQSGRARGQTERYMYYADSENVEPLLDLMAEVAADPTQVVVQVVFPLIDVGPQEWIRFCHDVTGLGNHRISERPVLACAPLHPELEFSMRNANTLIPLLRRSPDPTIQWVRLDGLKAIYAGRNHNTVFVDPDDLPEFLKSTPMRSLYDRIAESNLSMTRRLKVPYVEGLLAEYARDGRQSYARVLLADC